MRSRPIVAQHSWQERFNKLFQPTPMVSFVPLGIPSQRQSAEGFTIDDSADVVSKPTTERMFTEDLMFGAEPTVKMPRIAPANNATPQPTGASFKATVNIPMGDETASCTIEVPTAEFAGADGDEVTARTRKRMADFSAQIISSIVSATQDAESERPKKRQRREASPVATKTSLQLKKRPSCPLLPHTALIRFSSKYSDKRRTTRVLQDPPNDPNGEITRGHYEPPRYQGWRRAHEALQGETCSAH